MPSVRRFALLPLCCAQPPRHPRAWQNRAFTVNAGIGASIASSCLLPLPVPATPKSPSPARRAFFQRHFFLTGHAATAPPGRRRRSIMPYGIPALCAAVTSSTAFISRHRAAYWHRRYPLLFVHGNGTHEARAEGTRILRWLLHHRILQRCPDLDAQTTAAPIRQAEQAYKFYSQIKIRRILYILFHSFGKILNSRIMSYISCCHFST